MILAADEKQRRAALGSFFHSSVRISQVYSRQWVVFPSQSAFLILLCTSSFPTMILPNARAKSLGVKVDVISKRVHALHESTQCLVTVVAVLVFPIRKSQRCRHVRFQRQQLAITEEIKVIPEVMIPLVGFADELKNQVSVVHRVAAEVMEKKDVKFNCLVGTMIEVPCGALTTDEIAETAEFFSFGLTT